MAMADRRRINGPSSSTALPVFLELPSSRTPRRAPSELRKICIFPPSPVASSTYLY